MEKVLFTDESKFELFGSKHLQFVRRVKGERTAPQSISPTVKHVGGLVLAWGCFGGNKTGDIVKIEGIVKNEQHHNDLQCHAKASGMRLIGKGSTLQQDNDLKHTSLLCRRCVE